MAQLSLAKRWPCTNYDLKQGDMFNLSPSSLLALISIRSLRPGLHYSWKVAGWTCTWLKWYGDLAPWLPVKNPMKVACSAVPAILGSVSLHSLHCPVTCFYGYHWTVSSSDLRPRKSLNRLMIGIPVYEFCISTLYRFHAHSIHYMCTYLFVCLYTHKHFRIHRPPNQRLSQVGKTEEEQGCLARKRGRRGKAAGPEKCQCLPAWIECLSIDFWENFLSTTVVFSLFSQGCFAFFCSAWPLNWFSFLIWEGLIFSGAIHLQE